MHSITADLFPETLLIDSADGVLTTTSLNVAKHFHKRHDNVLRAIANLKCSEQFRRLNFEASSYLDKRKKRRREMFLITKDGFWNLSMGFTGPEAAAWRESFIDAFNALEAELRARTERFARAFDQVRPHYRSVVELSERNCNRQAIAAATGLSPAGITYRRRMARQLQLVAA